MNRKKAPAIKDATAFSLKLKPYEHYTLDNGVPVYCIHAGSQEVLQLEWVFNAGNCYEESKGIAAAANFLLKNGTSTKTAFEINEAFDYYGAWCNRTCYNETAVVSLHCLTKHLGTLLPVVQEMLFDSVFPEEELQIYKQNAGQRLMVNLKKCEFVAGRLIDSYVYGDKHPYGVYTSPLDIEALQLAPVKAFYEKYYKQGTCALFVSGYLPPDLREQLNKNFGQASISAPSGILPAVQSVPATEKKYRVQNDPDAVQGAVRLAIPFPNRHHPDFQKAIVLNNVFGGFFGSRLMSNIREDKGYTYGIYSYIQNHIQQSAWLVSTEAGKDVCEATIDEVYKEMALLREELVTEDELNLVRNYMIGGILGDLDGPFHIMAKWKNIILNQLDEQYFYQSIETIKQVSPEELRELANRYLQPENFYELVVY
ncbi:MAG TPA: insulinase family protein [Chitinophagaceae bacterium]|nr:insulinase family protein [Chitinophagaceae bacterium]